MKKDKTKLGIQVSRQKNGNDCLIVMWKIKEAGSVHSCDNDGVGEKYPCIQIADYGLSIFGSGWKIDEHKNSILYQSL